MILDNGRFHKAKKLSIPTNVQLKFLPPYSPELNPVERFWQDLKDTHLLGRFFGAGTASVEFAENFGLQTLSRSEEGSFDFDQLSAGAKQQLSVLIRLAMARLIAEERPHPVFLDDALSDTDPDRFTAIANILRSVARDMQIIMTTCHHKRHRRLGVQTKPMESLKQQGSDE